jgi:hypothetical protein
LANVDELRRTILQAEPQFILASTQLEFITALMVDVLAQFCAGNASFVIQTAALSMNDMQFVSKEREALATR